jgi:hypothetical protein
MTQPIGVRERFYNKLERKEIDQFKDAYMRTTTPAERKTIAQSDICPTLFTYWSSIGVILTPEEKNKRCEVSIEFLNMSLNC